MNTPSEQAENKSGQEEQQQETQNAAPVSGRRMNWASGSAEDDTAQIHIGEIQHAYRRIDGKWLKLHYRTAIGLVIAAFLLECLMGLYFINSDLLTSSVNTYITKFIVVPSGINFLLAAALSLLMRSRKISQKTKVYMVSLTFVALCFIFSTAHNAFSSIYYIYAIAILLTSVYTNYRVSAVASLVSILLMIVSELWIVWDYDKTSIFESSHRMSDFMISLLVLSTFFGVTMVVIRFEKAKNEASILMELERHVLQQKLQIDELTGIPNRKALHTALLNIEKSDKSSVYILAVADIDHFKAINDTWGHHFGDQCLLAFARILKERSAHYTPFRYGGDEFCLLFEKLDMPQAVSICKDIQQALTATLIDGHSKAQLTASFGLAHSNGRTDPVRFFTRADQALYAAKKERGSIHISKTPSDNTA